MRAAPARFATRLAGSASRSSFSSTAATNALLPQHTRGQRREVVSSRWYISSPATCAASSAHIRPFTSSSSSLLLSRVHQSPHAALESGKKDMSENIRAIITPELLQDVKDFWFEHLEGEAVVVPEMEDMKRWFMGGGAMDKICLERYASTLEAIQASGITSGQDIIEAVQPSTSSDWLGLILLLDQIPRNCYRGDSAKLAFTVFDPLALDISKAAISQGIPEKSADIRWQFARRLWMYMPLVHSEDLASHDLAIKSFELIEEDIETLLKASSEEENSGNDKELREQAVWVVQDREDAAKKFGTMTIEYEKRHRDVIERFGRYPHRNKAMGREPTAEEVEYLENGGETFTS